MWSQVYNYLIFLLAGIAAVGLFVAVYIRITPFHELALIRKGHTAAALSLGGATVGFSLTVASSALHNNTMTMFAVWGALALVVQLVAYLIVARLVPNLREALERNNVAVGALLGTAAIVLGILNAACLS